MKFGEIHDQGQSEIDSFAIYTNLFGGCKHLVHDTRADRLLKLEDFLKILEEHFEMPDTILETIGSRGRSVYYSIPKFKILIDAYIRQEASVDIKAKQVFTLNENWEYDSDEDENTYMGSLEGISSRNTYNIVTNIKLFYNKEHCSKVEAFWKAYDKLKFSKSEIGKGVIYLITKKHDSIRLTGEILNIKTYGKDIIESNYNVSFIPAYNKIKEFISTKSGGFVLLNGPPGTGKSSLILHLTSIAEELNRKFVLIPPSFGYVLTDPSFMTFCMENLKKAVLVIEDAEHILRSRKEDKTNTAVTNLLNLTDGILSNLLDLKIIATVNVDDSIDKALLRKGRLKVQYYFDALETEKANKLLIKLKSDRVVTESHTLADLYNIAEQVEFDGKTVRKKPMGYKR